MFLNWTEIVVRSKCTQSQTPLHYSFHSLVRPGSDIICGKSGNRPFARSPVLRWPSWRWCGGWFPRSFAGDGIWWKGGGPQCQIDVISTWIQCMHVFARACGGVGPWNSLGLGGAVFPRGQRLLAHLAPRSLWVWMLRHDCLLSSSPNKTFKLTAPMTACYPWRTLAGTIVAIAVKGLLFSSSVHPHSLKVSLLVVVVVIDIHSKKKHSYFAVK